MSANKRLDGMRSALLERGVTDVKFCFSWRLEKTPSSQVAANVADFLDAYLKERSTSVDRIGDSLVKQ